jgi:hypothetical protein
MECMMQGAAEHPAATAAVTVAVTAEFAARVGDDSGFFPIGSRACPLLGSAFVWRTAESHSMVWRS